MSETIKVRVKRTGDLAEVKSLIVHPMETGAREDPETGEIVSRHHITRLVFSNNGTVVMAVNCSTAVSRNPYVNFSFTGVRTGDTFSVRWVDNKGETDSLETTIE